MNRKKFIETLNLNIAGNFSGIPIEYDELQRSVVEQFENENSFILISPRQTGRTISIMANILYDILHGSARETYIVVPHITVKEVIISLFDRVNPDWILSVFDEVHFVLPKDINKIPINHRKYKRIVITEAVAVPDRHHLFEMIQGWDHIVLETIGGKMNKFNSLFVKNLIDFDGLNIFNIVKYSYKQLGKTEEWLDRHKDIFGVNSGVFKREILLEWT